MAAITKNSPGVQPSERSLPQNDPQLKQENGCFSRIWTCFTKAICCLLTSIANFLRCRSLQSPGPKPIPLQTTPLSPQIPPPSPSNIIEKVSKSTPATDISVSPPAEKSAAAAPIDFTDISQPAPPMQTAEKPLPPPLASQTSKTSVPEEGMKSASTVVPPPSTPVSLPSLDVSSSSQISTMPVLKEITKSTVVFQSSIPMSLPPTPEKSLPPPLASSPSQTTETPAPNEVMKSASTAVSPPPTPVSLPVTPEKSLPLPVASSLSKTPETSTPITSLITKTLRVSRSPPVQQALKPLKVAFVTIHTKAIPLTVTTQGEWMIKAPTAGAARRSPIDVIMHQLQWEYRDTIKFDVDIFTPPNKPSLKDYFFAFELKPHPLSQLGKLEGNSNIGFTREDPRQRKALIYLEWQKSDTQGTTTRSSLENLPTGAFHFIGYEKGIIEQSTWQQAQQLKVMEYIKNHGKSFLEINEVTTTAPTAVSPPSAPVSLPVTPKKSPPPPVASSSSPTPEKSTPKTSAPITPLITKTLIVSPPPPVQQTLKPLKVVFVLPYRSGRIPFEVTTQEEWMTKEPIARPASRSPIDVIMHYLQWEYRNTIKFDVDIFTHPTTLPMKDYFFAFEFRVFTQRVTWSELDRSNDIGFKGEDPQQRKALIYLQFLDDRLYPDTPNHYLDNPPAGLFQFMGCTKGINENSKWQQKQQLKVMEYIKNRGKSLLAIK